MKLKLIPILAGVSALTVTIAPLAVKAEPTAPVLPHVASQVKERSKMAELNLTEEQKAQMAEVRRSTRTQIEAILTPEQREKFQAAMENRQQRRANLAELNLSEEQKAQMREIRKSAKSRMEAILTPEQRQQVQQRRQNREQQRQQQNQ